MQIELVIKCKFSTVKEIRDHLTRLIPKSRVGDIINLDFDAFKIKFEMVEE